MRGVGWSNGWAGGEGSVSLRGLAGDLQAAARDGNPWPSSGAEENCGDCDHALGGVEDEDLPPPYGEVVPSSTQDEGVGETEGAGQSWGPETQV